VTTTEIPEELPPATAPAEYSICLRGFESEEAAISFGNALRATVQVLSSYIDLERLDGITVAYDYPVALAELDRGIKTTGTLKATDEVFATGVAMTPAVIREGHLKAHIVLNADVVRALESTEDIDFNILYILAHECGHVQDLKTRDNAFPDTLLRQRYTDTRAAAIFFLGK
jgi:hypothetical protein